MEPMAHEMGSESALPDVITAVPETIIETKW